MKIRAAIKSYENNSTYYYRCNDNDGIYIQMMHLTDGDHEISDDAASWCELAIVGEIYEFLEGEIEIIDIE